MSICKCRNILFLKIINILSIWNVIFGMLKYYFLCWNRLIIESLWRIHDISVLSLSLKTLNQWTSCISSHLINLMNRILSLIIICFFLLRRSLITASCKSTWFNRGRIFKLILTILFVRSILINFRLLKIILSKHMLYNNRLYFWINIMSARFFSFLVFHF